MFIFVEDVVVDKEKCVVQNIFDNILDLDMFKVMSLLYVNLYIVNVQKRLRVQYIDQKLYERV